MLIKKNYAKYTCPEICCHMALFIKPVIASMCQIVLNNLYVSQIQKFY